MALTFSWTIPQGGLHAINNASYDNVLVSVAVRISVSEGDRTESIIAYADIPFNPDSSFIPFNNLTEDKVIQWAKEAMGPKRVSQFEDAVRLRFTPRTAPVTVSAPWSTCQQVL